MKRNVRYGFQWQVLLFSLLSEWYLAFKEVINMFKLFAKASFGLVIGLENVNKII